MYLFEFELSTRRRNRRRRAYFGLARLAVEANGGQHPFLIQLVGNYRTKLIDAGLIESVGHERTVFAIPGLRGHLKEAIS